MLADACGESEGKRRLAWQFLHRSSERYASHKADQSMDLGVDGRRGATEDASLGGLLKPLRCAPGYAPHRVEKPREDETSSAAPSRWGDGATKLQEGGEVLSRARRSFVHAASKIAADRGLYCLFVSVPFVVRCEPRRKAGEALGDRRLEDGVVGDPL